MRYAVQLLFADRFIVVADSADGTVPLLSKTLLDATIAAVRRCAGKSNRWTAETGARRS